jgi:hypothetical protein
LLEQCGGFWSAAWPAIVMVIIALWGAVGTAIWAYFFLHDDVRNLDGTRLTARDKWKHIFALLAFYTLGFLVFGGGAVVVYRIYQSF